MDAVSPLAAQLVTLLSPLLPKLAEGAADAGADLARRVWGRIAPRAEQKPALKEALDDVAAAPSDADAQAALRIQLRKLLQEDASLREELEKTLAQAGQSNTVNASGERSVAVGGNVSGGTIITGDRNRIGNP
jgi:hypothetical protein